MPADPRRNIAAAAALDLALIGLLVVMIATVTIMIAPAFSANVDDRFPFLERPESIAEPIAYKSGRRSRRRRLPEPPRPLDPPAETIPIPTAHPLFFPLIWPPADELTPDDRIEAAFEDIREAPSMTIAVRTERFKMPEARPAPAPIASDKAGKIIALFATVAAIIVALFMTGRIVTRWLKTRTLRNSAGTNSRPGLPGIWKS